ncbi:hypothetical protein JZ751_025511 [Albula glossodonta]|uniref:PDZ domain-containing protein n=1 Tax=Albula glossodonta TaxID=121402 RepID=A0A8T2NDV2_9TELE|nr:hypothetical protein JZ751_025511 [Albula glossodonta]
MDQKIPYDDYQLPVVFLPSYESPPAWIAPQDRIHHPDYNNELTQFLPRTIILKKPPGAQLGFNIRGGKASQLGIFISKVASKPVCVSVCTQVVSKPVCVSVCTQVVPDSDAHRAGLQEGDQVLSVNDVDFQDIEHSRAVEILKTAREILMRVRFFPYSEYLSQTSSTPPVLSHLRKIRNFIERHHGILIVLPETEGEDCPLDGAGSLGSDCVSQSGVSGLEGRDVTTAADCPTSASVQP